MIVIPDSLKQEIEKLRGRRLQVRCRIDYSDANIDNTIISIASTVGRGSDIAQVYNGIEDVTKKWASLDGHCTPDGTFYLPPSSTRQRSINEIGWWGAELSNPDGSYMHEQVKMLGENLFGEDLFTGYSEEPNLYVSFAERTLSQIRLSFDNKRNEYAKDFDIYLYNNLQEIIYTLEIRNNSGLKYVTEITQQTGVVLMRIKIITWSLNSACAKIAEMFTSISEMYNGSDILSLQVVENRDLSDEGLPMGTTASGQCVLTMVNKDRLFDYDNSLSKLYNVIREGNRIVPEIGDGTNWIPLGVFYAKAWDISKRSLSLTVTGLDMMAKLGESDYQTNQIIQAPADQSFLTDTNAEWAGGSLEGIEVVGDTIRLVF